MGFTDLLLTGLLLAAFCVQKAALPVFIGWTMWGALTATAMAENDGRRPTLGVLCRNFSAFALSSGLIGLRLLIFVGYWLVVGAVLLCAHL